MKHLVIIGGGGMGKDIYHSARHSIGYGTEYDIKGFIDDNLNSLDGCEGYPPVLDTIKNYQPSEDDVFTCSIGNVKTKRTLCEMIKDRGGKFITLLHETAQLGENVKLGDGCIIDSHAHIGSDTIIGENCLVQTFAGIGHDCRVGDYCRIDVRAFLVGGVRIEENVTIHTNAILNHHVVVEKDAVVAALSFVVRKVKAGTTVFGNPAKLLKY